MMRRIQEVQNLQLQNIRLQQEIENARIQQEKHRTKENSQQSGSTLTPAAGSALPLPTSEYLIGGLLNCRAWDAAEPPARLSYLAAAADATLLLLYEVEKGADASKYMPAALNNSEASVIVGQLCGQPENKPVPVIFIYRLMAAKANGVAQEEIERRATFFRGIAAREVEKASNASR